MFFNRNMQPICSAAGPKPKSGAGSVSHTHSEAHPPGD
jgi:hypothetical protein